jgi:hypothetical protein
LTTAALSKQRIHASLSALAANADALKNVDMTDLGGCMFLRLPGNTIGGETP